MLCCAQRKQKHLQLKEKLVEVKRRHVSLEEKVVSARSERKDSVRLHIVACMHINIAIEPC